MFPSADEKHVSCSDYHRSKKSNRLPNTKSKKPSALRDLPPHLYEYTSRRWTSTQAYWATSPWDIEQRRPPSSPRKCRGGSTWVKDACLLVHTSRRVAGYLHRCGICGRCRHVDAFLRHKKGRQPSHIHASLWYPFRSAYARLDTDTY